MSIFKLFHEMQRTQILQNQFVSCSEFEVTWCFTLFGHRFIRILDDVIFLHILDAVMCMHTIDAGCYNIHA